jgi:hypothetical protein
VISPANYTSFESQMQLMNLTMYQNQLLVKATKRIHVNMIPHYMQKFNPIEIAS